MLGLIYLAAALGLASAAPLVQRENGLLSERQLPDGDACGRLQGATGALSPLAIHNCLETIPIYQSTKDNIMSVVKAFYAIDVFAVNQLGNPDPALNQGIDVEAEFARIEATQYSSDYTFQRDLSRVMASLNDGHHHWTSCYDQFFATQHALPIVSFSSNPQSTSPGVYIASDVETFINAYGFGEIYESFDIYAKDVAGAQVLQMEGKDVWTYLEEDLLPYSGSFTDKQQRMNSLFASYTAGGGTFGRFAGLFTSTDDLTRNNITMLIQTAKGEQKELVLPWITMWADGGAWSWKTGQDFWDAKCNGRNIAAAQGTSNAAKTQSSPPPVMNAASDLQAFAAKSYSECPVGGVARFPLSGSPVSSANYLGGRDVQFFKLDEGTGVVNMPTFFPEPFNEACQDRFVIDLVMGLQNLTKTGVKNVLVDTSNNGGGAVTLSQAAQRLFTGDSLLKVNNFETVFRKAPLNEAFHQYFLDNPGRLKDALYAPDTWRGPNSTENLSQGTNIFEPGQVFRINGRDLATSNRILDSLQPIELVDSMYGIPDQAPFAQTNIVFTGNGICGSACASFTNFLIEYYNATGYINAAQPSEPIEFTAFAAGQSTTASQIYAQADLVQFKNDQLMPRLKHAGEFGFAVRASISPRIAPNTFLQYRSYPAQNRFALTRDMYESPLKMWDYVAGQVFA